MTSRSGWSSHCAWLVAVLFVLTNAEIDILVPKSGKIYTQTGRDMHIKVVGSSGEQMSMCHQAVGATTCEEFTSGSTKDYIRSLTSFTTDAGVVVEGIVIEYSPKGITGSAAGVYKITRGVETKIVEVHFVNIEAVNGTLYEEDEDVTIDCRVTGLTVKYTMTWVKDEHIVTQSEQPHIAVNDSFTIMDAKRQDVGPYLCIVTPEGSVNNMSATAYIHSPPFLKKFERAKNLVQGDTAIVECPVYGYPTPKVTWIKNEEPLKPDNRTIIGMYNGIQGAKLTIRDLIMEDRAEYGCEATNMYNTTTQFISIRVKDKYAALWPFLGICCEVIILCAIIFIYERRRNKKNANKDKTTEKTSAQNGNGDGARQRNNKNTVKA